MIQAFTEVYSPSSIELNYILCHSNYCYVTAQKHCLYQVLRMAEVLDGWVCFERVTDTLNVTELGIFLISKTRTSQNYKDRVLICTYNPHPRT